MLTAGASTRSGGGGRARRAATRGDQHTSAFANDPVRSTRLSISQELAAPLGQPAHLQTGLLDFLIQNAFTTFLADERAGFVMPSKSLLIASSNSYEFLKIMTDVEKYPPSSHRILDPIRQGYRAYGSS